MVNVEVKSFRHSKPGLPTWRNNPPFAPAACCRFGVPDNKLASVSVEADTTNGNPVSAFSSSVFALDGGATRPSQTGSPGNRLAATVPSMA